MVRPPKIHYRTDVRIFSDIDPDEQHCTGSSIIAEKSGRKNCAPSVMRFILIISLIFMSFTSLAQHLGHLHPNIVFADKARVRDQPSLSSNVLGVLMHNQKIQLCNRRTHQDTLNGRPGYWMEIRWQDSSGFVWQSLLADVVLASKTDRNDSFLLKHEPTELLKIKVFKKGGFYREFDIPASDSGRVIGFVSYGKTWNSNGKEIMAVVFETRDYILLEWDGNSLNKSNIELRDASLLTREYVPYDSSIINTTGVNIRAFPNDTSTILSTLTKYSRVIVTKQYAHYNREDKECMHWHQIAFGDSVAYVCANYLDIPSRCIYNNYSDRKNLKFISTNNALYVMEGNEIIDRAPGYADEDDDLIHFGNKGFDEDHQFIAVCYSANSCGQAGGDRYFLWDGKKLKYFGDDYTVGDGGLTEAHDLIFPDESGLKDQMILSVWDTEASVVKYDDCEPREADFKSLNTHILEFTGDTLVEVPSLHSKLREILKSQYPKYYLLRYEFYDFNGDGKEDAFFFLSDRSYKYPKTLLGYALGKSNDNFGKPVAKKHLVEPGYHSVNFYKQPEGYIIEVINDVGMYDGNYYNAQKVRYTYNFDQDNTKLVWKMKSVQRNVLSGNDEERGVKWSDPEIVYFNTNKIFFEDSWR